MTEPIKVTHAVCPSCHLHVALDDDGHYARHIQYGHKARNGEIANCVCDGTGLKPEPMHLRMERKRVRDVQAIQARHDERQRLKKELEPAAERLRCRKSVNVDDFIGLLKAYGLWEGIPARRKHTIKFRLTCLQYDGESINVILHRKGNHLGIMPLARELLSRIIP